MVVGLHRCGMRNGRQRRERRKPTDGYKRPDRLSFLQPIGNPYRQAKVVAAKGKNAGRSTGEKLAPPPVGKSCKMC